MNGRFSYSQEVVIIAAEGDASGKNGRLAEIIDIKYCLAPSKGRERRRWVNCQGVHGLTAGALIDTSPCTTSPRPDRLSVPRPAQPQCFRHARSAFSAAKGVSAGGSPWSPYFLRYEMSNSPDGDMKTGEGVKGVGGLAVTD